VQLEQKVIEAKNGNKQAYVELVKNNKEMLYRTAFMYVKNEHDALEIVDETVYKAYISINKLKNEKYFNTWITRILINCALDYKKSSKRVIPLDETSGINKKFIYDEENNREEIIDLYEAVDKLQGKYKTIIILKYFRDMRIRDIANILCCSESNVKNYLHKSLVKLRIDLREGELSE
jgi:RNA polymerase sigma-70 factor (ECF subfamily)